jgi:hypothetical protein
MWLIFHQTPYDTVRYRTSETDNNFSLPYNKFLTFLFENYRPVRRIELINELDRFETIVLDKDTGEWKVIIPEVNIENFSFQKLAEENNGILTPDAQKEKPEEIQNLNRSKSFIENMWNNTKSKGIFPFQRRLRDKKYGTKDSSSISDFNSKFNRIYFRR